MNPLGLKPFRRSDIALGKERSDSPVVDVVVLAPGLGGKQMLYTQRAFFLEIVGPNWDNIYRIGDVQKEHDFD